MDKKESLLIIGAGSFSTEVEEIARIQGYTDIAFLDDDAPSAIGTMQVIGKLRDPEGVTIGTHCFFNHFVHLHNGANKDTTISFGDNVFIGPDVSFVCASHEYGFPTQRAGKNKYGSITVENGVWIGAGATILPGVKIARGG